MRMLALGLFASTALCTSAFAADVPVVPETTWTGFYAGLEVGYAFADKAEYDTGYDGLNDLVNEYTDLLEHDLDGLLGGVYGGFNWQNDSFVFGLEGSFAGAAIEGSESFDYLLYEGWCKELWLAAETETEINWLATATGRFGFLASDNLLLFVKGGAAFADIDAYGSAGLDVYNTHKETTKSLIGASIEGNETAFGFIVGAGAEWKFAQNWSAKAEYNYVRFEDVDFSGDYEITICENLVDSGKADFSADVDLHLVKVGVAYHF
ncbi:membrane protein [Terrihabitans soli]|uniref:Membrane protein n=1 Tax=Terrihabitans soli TaxID=708113 RepID=A0A6S6QIJ8_9HYPH|nr:outer membrane beta-barrel protein [Terrihabitans soli]BCJ91073.1 membrane protein [Terrihabitans soli]